MRFLDLRVENVEYGVPAAAADRRDEAYMAPSWFYNVALDTELARAESQGRWSFLDKIEKPNPEYTTGTYPVPGVYSGAAIPA